MSEKVKLPAAESLSMRDLVDYQAGSIVSREIVKNKSGTLTLFAFDRGQGLSEHSAPFDALAQVLDGSAEVFIGGKAVTVVAGRAVLMPANVPHALEAKERFKMLLTMIKDPV